MHGASEWFLSKEERANPSTTVGGVGGGDNAWTVGNRVQPLIHGAVYFSRLVDRLSALEAGDQVLLTDWRGDDDELLEPQGPRLGESLSGLATRRVEIRGLLWRSHPRMFGFNEKEASDLAGIVNGAGGTV
ncbi:MAG: phospholipase, partial [Actinomycetota bacterium]